MRAFFLINPPLAVTEAVGTAAAGCVYTNRLLGPVGLAPPGPSTRTSTDPLPGGEVTVITVSLTTFNSVPGLAPKLTPVAPVKPVPVRVTAVSPSAGPPVGLTAVIFGMSVATARP
ncbi:hypothetical protein D3C76_1602560 [compost metagenome]